MLSLVVLRQLTTDFSIHSEVTYYNEALSLWEPFLEPVAVQRGKYQPWSFQVQVSQDAVCCPKSTCMLMATSVRVLLA